MALEIERRFLVAGEAWSPLVVWSQSLDQGYLLASAEGPTLRVRSTRSSGALRASPAGQVASEAERAEAWLFWPMGISEAGSMRQWGHHATAFVGRRHFDDADLLDRRFVKPAK